MSYVRLSFDATAKSTSNISLFIIRSQYRVLGSFFFGGGEGRRLFEAVYIGYLTVCRAKKHVSAHPKSQ